MKPNIEEFVRKGQRPLLVKNFWDKVRPGDGCWEWGGRKDRDGYGIITGGKHIQARAHRLSHAILKGSIPTGLVVLHQCDNPGCCNPAHLAAGTPADNVRDMHEKGRDNHHVKISENQAMEIRALEGKLTMRKIAEMYGVTRSLVGLIIGGQVKSKTFVPHRIANLSRKLNSEKVLQIRELLKTHSVTKVALQLQMSDGAIRAIKEQRTWKWVI